MSPGRAGDAPGRGAGGFAAEWERHERVYLARLRESSWRVGGDWRDKLRAGAWTSVALARRHPDGARLLVVAAPEFGRAGQTRQRLLGERLVEMLEGWRAESGLEADVASSRWALGVFYAGFYRCVSGEDLDRLATEVPQLMFLAVSPTCGVEAALEELDRPPP